jgi:hypothetical protein
LNNLAFRALVRLRIIFRVRLKLSLCFGSVACGSFCNANGLPNTIVFVNAFAVITTTTGIAFAFFRVTKFAWSSVQSQGGVPVELNIERENAASISATATSSAGW